MQRPRTCLHKWTTGRLAPQCERLLGACVWVRGPTQCARAGGRAPASRSTRVCMDGRRRPWTVPSWDNYVLSLGGGNRRQWNWSVEGRDVRDRMSDFFTCQSCSTELRERVDRCRIPPRAPRVQYWLMWSGRDYGSLARHQRRRMAHRGTCLLGQTHAVNELQRQGGKGGLPSPSILCTDRDRCQYLLTTHARQSWLRSIGWRSPRCPRVPMGVDANPSRISRIRRESVANPCEPVANPSANSARIRVNLA